MLVHFIIGIVSNNTAHRSYCAADKVAHDSNVALTINTANKLEGIIVDYFYCSSNRAEAHTANGVYHALDWWVDTANRITGIIIVVLASITIFIIVNYAHYALHCKNHVRILYYKHFTEVIHCINHHAVAQRLNILKRLIWENKKKM